MIKEKMVEALVLSPFLSSPLLINVVSAFFFLYKESLQYKQQQWIRGGGVGEEQNYLIWS